MKHTIGNCWLKLLAGLLALAIIVMLLIPAELTDEHLSQVKSGMSIQQANQLLGQSCSKAIMGGAVISFPGYVQQWSLRGTWFRQHLFARIPDNTVPMRSPIQSWVGKTSILLVAHENGIVTTTWLFPITRTGGGIQGCIDTIKEYWNDWWK